MAGLTMTDVDAVAVTRGPGMAPCLSVGMTSAKSMAAVLDKPLFAVHHMVLFLPSSRPIDPYFLGGPRADGATR